MPDCPFCDPDPMRIVWEADGIYAMRDGYPVTPGHTLVIPRRHIPTYFDATQDEQREIRGAVLQVRAELDRTLEPTPDGYNVGFNAGQSAGDTVIPHARDRAVHVW